MQLSAFFRSHYQWLDGRGRELGESLSSDRLHRFVQEAFLVLACEHEILRPAVLGAVSGADRAALKARFRQERQRATLEEKLAQLARAPGVAQYRDGLARARAALLEAAARAHAWATVAESVLSPRDATDLAASMGRCHGRCSILAPTIEDSLRVEMIH